MRRVWMASHFKDAQRDHQITWRRANISTQNYGVHNGARYAHVLPRVNWRENLWAEIRKELEVYIADENIQAHTGTHNLLSSWVNCANLYFPVRLSGEMRELMLGFLNTKLVGQILSIDAVELEFALKGDLSPEVLLGETGGKRGTSQTSPDVAFLVTTRKGKGIILIESKYTEHSFYRCSARTTKRRTRRPANPDITRCMQQGRGLRLRSDLSSNRLGAKVLGSFDVVRIWKTYPDKMPLSNIRLPAVQAAKSGRRNCHERGIRAGGFSRRL